jgi:hypothetical protein
MSGGSWPSARIPHHATKQPHARRLNWLRAADFPGARDLSLSLLRDFQRVIDLDAKVSNSVLQLGLTEQELLEGEIPKMANPF